MDLQEIIKQVKALAVEAGAFVRNQRQCFTNDMVVAKYSHDYVSHVDKDTEDMIVEGLSAILPEAGFVTEESTDMSMRDLRRVMDDNYEYCWVIDPLDGTTNFIHGLSPYCISIALRNAKEVLLAVVYEVTANNLYHAYKGGGAYRDDVRISVSDMPVIDDALISLGLPYDVDKASSFYTHLSASLYGKVASLRNLGSAEAELCYVADGRLDAYIEPCVFPWDVAAGALILREAGGRVTDFRGEDAQWESGREVLATNGKIHDELTRRVISSVESVKAVF